MAFFVALDFNASPITNFISKNAITAGLSGMFEPGALRWTTIFEPWAHHRNHHWGFFRLRPIISLPLCFLPEFFSPQMASILSMHTTIQGISLSWNL